MSDLNSSTFTRFSSGLIVFLLACLVFANSISNQFALDDLVHIVNNDKIHSLSSALTYFWSSTYPGDLYRPLTMLSYALNYEFSALNPLPYHLVNVILHGLVAILVLRLLSQLINRETAFIVSLFFAAHPMFTEVVANVSGRAEILSAFCVLLGLNLTISQVNRPSLTPLRMAGSICLLTLLGLLAKENAGVLVLLLPLCVWFKYGSFGSGTARSALIGSWVGLIIYLLLRLQALGSLMQGPGAIDFLDNPLIESSFWERVTVALALLGRYVSLLIAPINLSADYSFAHVLPALNTADFQDTLYLLITFVLIFSLALLRDRSSVGIFSAWYLLAFAVTANILFPIGTIFAERLVYLPSIGVLVLLAGLIEKLTSQTLRWVIVSIILGLYCGTSILHNPAWFNNASLFNYQIKVSPESAKTQANYAISLRNEARLDEAAIHLRQALTIYPSYAQAAYGLGSIYALRKNTTGAEHWYYRALRMNSKHLDSLNGLGRVYLERGDLDAAQEKFNSTLKIDKQNFEAKLGQMAIALRRKDFSLAAELGKELSLRKPNHPELRSLIEKLSGKIV